MKIIMPQHFKFVFLLFDCNVEKLQVRPLDIRLLKIYSNNKPSDEVCSFVSFHFNQSIDLKYESKIIQHFLAFWHDFDIEIDFNQNINLGF